MYDDAGTEKPLIWSQDSQPDSDNEWPWLTGAKNLPEGESDCEDEAFCNEYAQPDEY